MALSDRTRNDHTNRLGTITSTTIYFVADSPWLASKLIKNPVTDIPVYIESIGTITGHRMNTIDEMREKIGEAFAMGFGGLRVPATSTG